MSKLFVNTEVKKSTFILTIILICFIFFQGLMYGIYINNQKQDYIEIMGSVMYKVRDINPELEKELMPIMTQKLSKEQRESAHIILNEYSITSNLDNNLFPNLRKNNGIFIGSIIFSVLIIILNYIQYNYFFKKVRSVTLAANKIVDSDYSILVNEDEEGDFSKLAVAFSNVRSIIRNNLSSIQNEKQYLVELLQNISHQLKTKIATLMLYNDILLNRKLTEEQRVQFLEDNRDLLDDMNLMIQNILKLARLDVNAIEFYKKEDNLNKTIEEVVYSFKDFADEANIELSLNLDEQINLLHDKFWMKEAISNIIKNSIEHTPQNGKVKIYISNNPAFSRVIIQDTGKGIAQEDIANIFKRFYKNKSSNKKDSVGIGLAISKSIIESHNGYIDIKSTKGEGTSFFITFIKY